MEMLYDKNAARADRRRSPSLGRRRRRFRRPRTARGPLPLKALDVQAAIDGLVARTDVAQTFVNTHADPR